MASRRHNTRRAKSHFSYTINEAAMLYGVERQTVRNWLSKGLVPNDSGRPVLIHGTALNRFHTARRDAAKTKCGPGELYCLGCKAPRRPAGSIAEYTPTMPTTGSMSAICPACDRIMIQRVGIIRLAQFKAELEVVIRPPREPIGKS
jgi:hypothetical protein